MSRLNHALSILVEHPWLTASAFAQHFWPRDAIVHRRVSNTGNGATRGKVAWLCAGSYLAKLVKSGYIKRVLDDNGVTALFSLTSKGRSHLEE